MKVDLDKILQEDRKRFMTNEERVARTKEAIEVVEESCEDDRVVKPMEIEEPVRIEMRPARITTPQPATIETPTSPVMSPPSQEIPDTQHTPLLQNSLETQDSAPEIQDNVPNTQDVPDNQDVPDTQDMTDTQDDSQVYNPAKSRWGRFATHWRRFTPNT